jgi:hypothetical protein
LFLLHNAEDDASVAAEVVGHFQHRLLDSEVGPGTSTS